MEEFNRLLIEYGLTARENPTNEEIKDIIYYLAGTIISEGGRVRIKGVDGRKKEIYAGDNQYNNVCYRALSSYADKMQINDKIQFNKKFNLGNEHENTPDFILRMLELKLISNATHMDLKFRKKGYNQASIEIQSVLRTKKEEIEEYFMKQKLQNMFVSEEFNQLEANVQLAYMIEGEVNRLEAVLNELPALEELENDVFQYLYQLVVEIMQEEKKRES